jgi:hypothetical protein
MALKNHIPRILLNASLLLIVLASQLCNPVSAFALDNSEKPLPNFVEFSQTVQNGKANILRGVYVSEVLALPVVQQPAGSPGYVSSNDGQLTQFSMAAQYGNVGLLAHNQLAGKYFSELAVGQKVRLVNGDGKVESFIVVEVLRYQALQPNSPWSSFRNLGGNQVLSAEEMFKRVYFGDRHVTFQTCIEENGNLSWGRLFVIAVPESVLSGAALSPQCIRPD